MHFSFSGKSLWRSGVDLGQLYDNATPSPTGSLSGPYFVESPGKTVIGVKGKTSNLACSIKNLGNLTVIEKTKKKNWFEWVNTPCPRGALGPKTRCLGKQPEICVEIKSKFYYK